MLKEVSPLCFNYIWDFSRQLSATHFCDSPDTPARYVPCGWEGKTFIQLLQGCHWDSLINHLARITQVGLNPKSTEISGKLPTDFSQLWTGTSGLYTTTIPGTGLPLPPRGRIKTWLCRRAVRGVAHPITQMAGRVLFSLTSHLISTNHKQNASRQVQLTLPYFVLGFPAYAWKALLPHEVQELLGPCQPERVL